MKKQNYSKNTLPLFALLALTACGGSSDSDPADIDNVEPVADNGEPATDMLSQSHWCRELVL